ncbi:hypothetical protein [Actinokineospora cianjurensis]|uniref:Uncharacterized protein n=1 Tax=Actinokineospora cianjurensis TaxID=585224 RepID=A0A421AXC2_9PSEU|nr:hypothetical protein [Actinokineospora cianjurensis]RLK54441.1 hypothetical protein CLV68_5993 [Actinokineospora cianjurensis]
MDRVPAVGLVDVPGLGIPDAHPMIIDFYASLAASAQSKYYEPSDWQFARFTLTFADRLVKSSKPSAQLLTAVNSALTDLLVSEGARRRVRLEIEREQTANNVVDIAAMFREQLTAVP